MATKVNVVLDSDNKKVRFEDISVGGVFEYEGATICELNRSLVLIL